MTKITQIAHAQDIIQQLIDCTLIQLFEIEITVDGRDDWLVVDIGYNYAKGFIVFEYDNLNLDSHHSGDVKGQRSSGYHWLDKAKLQDFNHIDEVLQEIYSEIMEGFIIPNNLYREETD